MDKHDDHDREQLCQTLASLRSAKKWKQDYAATQLGVTKAALSAWETGRNLPDALSLKKVARLYDSSADAILGLPAHPWPFPLVDFDRWEKCTPEDRAYIQGQIDHALTVLEDRRRQNDGLADNAEAEESDQKVDQSDSNGRRKSNTGHDPDRRGTHITNGSRAPSAPARKRADK